MKEFLFELLRILLFEIIKILANKFIAKKVNKEEVALAPENVNQGGSSN